MRSYLLLIASIFLFSSAFARVPFKVEGNSVLIELEGYGVKSKLLKVEIWSPNTVRIRSTMNNSFSDEATFLGTQPAEAVKFKAAYAQANLEIAAEGIVINVAEDGIVRILNGIGRKLLVEANRTFEKSENDNTYKINQKFYLNRGEHIYGFGSEDLQTRYTLTDQEFDVKQDETSVASPILISEKGFALIWNNFSPTHFNDTKSTLTLTSEVASDIDYFIISNPEWKGIISEIRKISGKAPMLPRWAYGFLLNPKAYNSENSLQEAVEKYHSLGIPVETQVTDASYCNEERELTSSAEDVRNISIYAYEKLKPKFEQLTNSNKRNVFDTHVNLPGIQQYGAISMAGDISQCWESLKGQIIAGINASLTGQPYWSTTLGGLKKNTDCNSEPLNELMIRWNQFAAFTPVYQGSPTGYEAWKVGNESDAKFLAIKRAIVLRYRLLPYIYTVANNVYGENDVLTGSLLFDYLKEEKLHTISQQYLFGPSIMVCPVAEPINMLKITLPAETNWVDFWTGKTYTGGTDVNMNVSIDHIPVFVKQGSIIPLATVGNNSSDSLSAPMEIRVYGGANAEFVLYEDENDGKGYTAEAFSKITFSYTEKNKTLTIGSTDGEYPGMITNRIFNVVLVSEKEGTGEGETVNPQVVEYKSKKTKVKFD